jgi:selenocysteine-specific elongation factor
VEIRPVVIGTAGHIDHGKSSLVRALTGIDPDRLKEEKERGLTIDLGFARFALPDGRVVGMIDVPGHERFIRNMVAGATGIDIVLLVVAADDGVMPQTVEHLSIMGLLGLRRGVIALNKIDLVDEELVSLAEEDVRAAVAGTFLADAPLVRVSATRGTGLAELRAVLERLADDAPARSDAGVFRMSVQRVFSARGFGTVLTGIPVSGYAQVGDVLEVLPGGQRGKVRGLQAYGEGTARVRAGHSSALNLADIDHHRVARGAVVATPGYFRGVRMLGARLRALPSLERPIADRASVHLHTGTAEVGGELVLLDAAELAPGAEGLVQLRLAEDVVCAPGDRYILRLASPAITLGGGTILEESRHRLKRFKGFVIEELARQESSLDSPRELLEVLLLRRGRTGATAAELSAESKLEPGEIERLLGELQASGRARALAGGARWLHVDPLAGALAQLERAASDWFAAQPHRSVVDTLELRRATGLEGALFAALLEEAAREGRLELRPGGQVSRPGRTAALDPAVEALCGRVEAALERGAFQPPQGADLAAAVGARENEVARALEALVDRGRVVDVGKGFHFSAARLARARGAIVDNCTRNGQLDIPQLRDALDTTRKWLIPLLEHFDVQGLTLRQGPNRVLRRRGG